MSSNNLCPICQTVEASAEYERSNDSHYYKCPRCGSFSADREFRDAYAKTPGDKDWRWLLSSSVRAATDKAGRLIEIITTDNFEDIIRRTPKPVNALEHADYLIAAIAERTKFLGSKTPEEEPNSIHPWVARSWLPSVDDLIRLNSELEKLGLFTHESSLGFSYQLTHAGWQSAIELKRSRGPGNQAFVAMWFHSDMEAAFSLGIHRALEAVGYSAYKVNDDPSPDMIDNRIIAEIRRSHRLVADCTGNRPSVYFEAGLAMGVGIDVIWCCNSSKREPPEGETRMVVPAHPERLDWFDVVAFDTRQYPHILWSTPTDLRAQLVDTIRARGLDLPVTKVPT